MYQCDNATCTFEALQAGCVAVYGTTTVDPGVYPLTISGTAYAGHGIFVLPITFPDPNFAPGVYELHVKEQGDPNCLIFNDTDAPTSISDVRVAPNPFAVFTDLTIDALSRTQYEFSLYNMMGERVQQRQLNATTGTNTYRIDGSELTNGIYLYTLREGDRVFSGKMVVNQ